MSAAAAAERPIHIIESGPAAGVVGAAELARRLGDLSLLSFDMGGEIVIDGEFENMRAVKGAQILERELEEGELVALEVLRHREAKSGARLAAERGENLDPEVDVAVGFGPLAIGAVQRMRRVAVGAKPGNGLHDQPHSASRTETGQVATSSP